MDKKQEYSVEQIKSLLKTNSLLEVLINKYDTLIKLEEENQKSIRALESTVNDLSKSFDEKMKIMGSQNKELNKQLAKQVQELTQEINKRGGALVDIYQAKLNDRTPKNKKSEEETEDKTTDVKEEKPKKKLDTENSAFPKTSKKITK